MTLARGASSKFSARMTTLSLFSARGSTDHGASSKFWARMTTLSVCGDAGVWSVLKVLGANNDLCVVFGAWQQWPVERPGNSGRQRRLSGCCRRVVTPARGAFSESCSESRTLSVFSGVAALAHGASMVLGPMTISRQSAAHDVSANLRAAFFEGPAGKLVLGDFKKLWFGGVW